MIWYVQVSGPSVVDDENQSNSVAINTLWFVIGGSAAVPIALAASRQPVAPAASPARTGPRRTDAAPGHHARPSHGREGHFHAPLYIPLVILHTKQTGAHEIDSTTHG